MKWRRRRKAEPNDEAAAALRRAEAAATDALRKQAQAKARGPRIAELASAIRGVREDNHFAESLGEIFRGQG